MKMIYKGTHSVYDMVYDKGRVYEVKEYGDRDSYRVEAEREYYYHPFKRLFAPIKDGTCDGCMNMCKRDKVCEFYQGWE